MTEERVQILHIETATGMEPVKDRGGGLSDAGSDADAGRGTETGGIVPTFSRLVLSRAGRR